MMKQGKTIEKSMKEKPGSLKITTLVTLQLDWPRERDREEEKEKENYQNQL